MEGRNEGKRGSERGSEGVREGGREGGREGRREQGMDNVECLVTQIFLVMNCCVVDTISFNPSVLNPSYGYNGVVGSNPT